MVSTWFAVAVGQAGVRHLDSGLVLCHNVSATFPQNQGTTLRCPTQIRNDPHELCDQSCLVTFSSHNTAQGRHCAVTVVTVSQQIQKRLFEGK